LEKGNFFECIEIIPIILIALGISNDISKDDLMMYSGISIFELEFF